MAENSVSTPQSETNTSALADITAPIVNESTPPSRTPPPPSDMGKPKPKRQRRVIQKGRMSKLFYDDNDSDMENILPLGIPDVIATAQPGTSVAEVIKGAQLGAPVATTLYGRLMQTVEVSALYYQKEDYLNITDLLPGEQYQLIAVYKTAFLVQEGEGYISVHDVLYPNGTYYALIVRFLKEEGDVRPREIIVPGSMKLYGQDDTKRDLLYKCISDMKISELLGDWLDIKDINSVRIPYPGQRIYQKITATKFLYDHNANRFTFL